MSDPKKTLARSGLRMSNLDDVISKLEKEKNILSLNQIKRLERIISAQKDK